MRALLLSLALAMPAYAKAPMIEATLECGSLVGKGRVRLVLGGAVKALVEIECGIKRT